MVRFIDYEEYMNSFEVVSELRTPKSIEEILAELDKMNEKLSKKLLLLDEEEIEERNDVYIYKTLRYSLNQYHQTLFRRGVLIGN